MGNPLIPNSPTLLIKEITDTYLKQNFKNLSAYFQSNNQLLGFNFFEVNLTKATTNYLLSHGLPYTPQDVIITRVTGPGVATFNYGLFDSKHVNITTTDACRLRFFVGTYYNFTSSVASNSTDQWSVGSVSGETSSGPAIYDGFGAPPTTLVGNVNDLYVDQSTGNIYSKFIVGNAVNPTWNQINVGQSTIQKSVSTGVSGFVFSSGLQQILDPTGKPITCSLYCDGSDVEVFLQDDGNGVNAGNLFIDHTPAYSDAQIYFYMDGKSIGSGYYHLQNNTALNLGAIPSSCFRSVITPPIGTHTFTAYIYAESNRGDQNLLCTVLCARLCK
jgi:hypothetical protein